MLAELLTRIAGLTTTGIQALRGDKTGALITSDGHARYQEAVLQGNCYTLATAAAGVTIAAANVFSASNAQPLVGVFNPQGSGVNAVMILARHVWNSGTPAAGGLVWATAAAPSGVTAANNTNPTNMLTQRASGSKVQGYVNAALTGITGNAVVWYAGGPTTGALAANANQTFFDEVAGLIVVPPGVAGGLFAAAAGTSPIVNASIFWEEEAI